MGLMQRGASVIFSFHALFCLVIFIIHVRLYFDIILGLDMNNWIITLPTILSANEVVQSSILLYGVLKKLKPILAIWLFLNTIYIVLSCVAILVLLFCPLTSMVFAIHVSGCLLVRSIHWWFVHEVYEELNNKDSNIPGPSITKLKA